ncbi:MAG: hypothetical protein AAFX87_22280 [Bacteroidota bacterium]
MCLFCEIQNNNTYDSSYPENYIFLECDSFYAKPALGAFIDGYVLINTKEHISSFSKLNLHEFNELEWFIREVSGLLKNLYKKDVLIFEHGELSKLCNVRNNCPGKCLDHAHLHMIPGNFDVVPLLKNNFVYQELEEFNELTKTQFGNYLYVRHNEDHWVFDADNKVSSQYLRRLIANMSGLGDKWNWVSHPFRDKIREFLSLLNSHKSVDVTKHGITQLR